MFCCFRQEPVSHAMNHSIHLMYKEDVGIFTLPKMVDALVLGENYEKRRPQGSWRKW
jgi:hypothetical protein